VTSTVAETREMAERHTILGWVLVPHAVVHIRQRQATAGDDDEKSNGDARDERKEKKGSLVHCT
jgi:hypothetical protein